jgi:hypothetical protein
MNITVKKVTVQAVRGTRTKIDKSGRDADITNIATTNILDEYSKVLRAQAEIDSDSTVPAS